MRESCHNLSTSLEEYSGLHQGSAISTSVATASLSSSTEPTRHKRQRQHDDDDEDKSAPAANPHCKKIRIQKVAKEATTIRKSTAQPRPVVQIQPHGIGPIDEPNDYDVLCGRGGHINYHTGNIQFREFVQARKKLYLAKTTKKLEKAHIAAQIVQDVRSMGGRFLKDDAGTGLWWDIGDQHAIKKVGQALRENAPMLRHELQDDVDNDVDAESGSNNSKGQLGDSIFDFEPLLF